MKTINFCTLFLATALLGACGGGGGGAAAPNPPASGVTLQSISVTPATLTVGTGASPQFTATGNYSDGTTQNLTATASWSAGTPAVATVLATGQATSVAAGSTAITAAASGVSGSAALTVTATATKQLASISVTPAAASINTGTTQQLTATGKYTDNTTADLTSSVTWVSSNSTLAAVNSSGLVNAVAVGNSVSVTASMGGASATSTLNVTAPADALTALVIAAGQPFVYMGQRTSPTTWVSGNFANGTGTSPYPAALTISACTPANAASIDATGLVVGNAFGTCTITAHSGAISSAPATLTVAIPYLLSIQIAPATVSLAAGTSLQLSATGTFQDGSQKDITNTLTWSSNNLGVATVVSNSGLVTGVAGGTATISVNALLPAANPIISLPTMTVTVPASAPMQSTAAQPLVWDNTISDSSLHADWKTTTYAVNAFHNNSIAVGCYWYLMYNPIAQMQVQEYSCAQSLVKFDVSALAGKTVMSATLKLTTGVTGVGTVPRSWYVHALAAPWSGTSVTWKNAPSTYYVASASNWNPPTSVGQIYNIDVTNTVRNWVSGAWPNNGFSMGINDVSFPYQISLDAFEFYSSEAGAAYGPQLIVVAQ